MNWLIYFLQYLTNSLHGMKSFDKKNVLVIFSLFLLHFREINGAKKSSQHKKERKRKKPTE